MKKYKYIAIREFNGDMDPSVSFIVDEKELHKHIARNVSYPYKYCKLNSDLIGKEIKYKVTVEEVIK